MKIVLTAIIIFTIAGVLGCKELPCEEALIDANIKILAQKIKIEQLQFKISLHRIKKDELKICLEDKS